MNKSSCSAFLSGGEKESGACLEKEDTDLLYHTGDGKYYRMDPK